MADEDGDRLFGASGLARTAAQVFPHQLVYAHECADHVHVHDVSPVRRVALFSTNHQPVVERWIQLV